MQMRLTSLALYIFSRMCLNIYKRLKNQFEINQLRIIISKTWKQEKKILLFSFIFQLHEVKLSSLSERFRNLLLFQEEKKT